ncbi:MAG: M16 family metallopeptidase, partial [Bacteroidota bacterium]
MKLLKSIWVMIALTAMFTTTVFAQDKLQEERVPLDPKVKKGKLENGLTYYIRHNETPENRAEFYLFNNVGAVLEMPEQNGLAHFTEHMAFNGTENFPGKGVLDYMENIGVKFGHNVNAFTSYDMTVYNLAQVPVKRESIIDSTLLVLHDWAAHVSFDGEEIDKERGVIHEEWRTRRGADFRMRNETNKVLFEGSKYAEHDIIGDIDIIDHAEHETLRNFYRDWYRPDLQAVAVVGDIDPDEIEKKINDMFGDLEVPEDPRERKEEEIPENKEPKVAVITDKEATRSMVQIYYKHDALTDKGMDYYKNTFVHQLYQRMLNNRLMEITQSSDAPFVYGYSYYGNVIRPMDAYVSLAIAGNDRLLDAAESLTTENERVARYGFTDTELERTKQAMLSDLKKQYNNRNKMKSRSLIWSYLSNFMSDEPVPGIEYEYEFAQEFLPQVALEDVNKLAQQWVTDENMVVAINAVEKEDQPLPKEEEVLKAVNAAKSKELEPYEDDVTDMPLISALPEAGEITEESQNEEKETYTYTLSNGLKIIVKPTDFKDNEILMKGYSPGGLSLVDDEDIASARLLPAIMSSNGLGEFSKTALDKKLADKNVSVDAYLSDLKEEIRGNAETEDFETMLKLLHLHFQEPRNDLNAYHSIMNRYRALLENRSADPRYIFQDSVQVTKANHHPRKTPFDIDLLEKADYQKAREIYKDRFSDASDFTFFFVGNIEVQEAKPLFEKYLGSIKAENRNENFVDHEINSPKGKTVKKIHKEMEVPKATVHVNLNGKAKYDLRNKILMDAIDHVLELRYTETIREEQGGSYGVGVFGRLSEYPESRFDLTIQFDCAPEKYEMLRDIVYQEIEKLYEDGPSDKDVKKAREYFIKSREEKLEENSFWLSALEKKEWSSADVL